ncbi:MAG: hypothetical protein NVS4B6_16480 [Mycobacterium sp.]
MMPIQTEQYSHRLPTRNGYIIDGRISWWKIQSRSQATVLTVSGELDASNADRFAECVDDLVVQGTPLIIDICALKFLGVQSFRTLADVGRACSDSGTRWALVIGPSLAHIFEVFDPDRALPRCDCLADALHTVTPVNGAVLRLVWRRAAR